MLRKIIDTIAFVALTIFAAQAIPAKAPMRAIAPTFNDRFSAVWAPGVYWLSGGPIGCYVKKRAPDPLRDPAPKLHHDKVLTAALYRGEGPDHRELSQ